MENINNKNDMYAKYKELAIDATKFVTNNKHVSEVTNELFITGVNHISTLYHYFHFLYCNTKLEDKKQYNHCHKLHTKTCRLLIKFIKRSEIFKEKKINFWEWFPYIWRYSNDLAIIKHLLNSVHINITNCQKELEKFIDNKKNENNNTWMLSRDVILPWILNAAISLRYSLELIIFQLKNNNIKSLKKSKLNNKIPFFELLNEYEKEKINFNIKDLSNFDKNLVIKNFWTKDKLGKVHAELGKIIHFQSKEHINWEFESYKEIKKYIDIQKNNINCLIKIRNTIFASMRDHEVSFERSKFVVNVRGFNIDINEIFNIKE